MNAVQPISEILPTVITHLHERTVMPVGVTPIEIEPTVHPDPDRAAHEIDPDAWHASVGVTGSNCSWCHDDGERLPNTAARRAALDAMKARLPGLREKAAKLSARHGGGGQ